MEKSTESPKDPKRVKIYNTIEHLNAAVNILRKLGRQDLAERCKQIIRDVNSQKEKEDETA